MDPAELIVIGNLSPDDWEAYRDLRLESLLNDPAAFGSKHEDAVLLGEADWRQRLIDGSMLFARCGRQVVGMVGALEEGGQTRIVSMYVSPAYRGRGLGRRLMLEILKRGEDTTVVLDVNPSQRAAYRLYESLGFVAEGESPFSGCQLRMRHAPNHSSTREK